MPQRYPMTPEPSPTAAELRAPFDAPEPMTVGLEEELMLLDPETLDLLPRAAKLVDAAGDERFKLEMPAAQLEITLPPERGVPAAIAALAAARRELAAAAAPFGALAANAPFHAGRDTGMASIRPKIAEQLPRQGIPPAIASWESFADALAWGAASGSVPDYRRWWWELRPHPAFGTLEVRVPDAQATVADAAAVAALVHALAGWLAARDDAGEQLETADIWRLEENRWSAARWGMDAELADLATGERTPARECLRALVADLGPVARRLGCAAE